MKDALPSKYTILDAMAICKRAWAGDLDFCALQGRQILYKIFFSDSPISGPSGSRQWPQSSCRGCHRQGSVEFFIGRCKAEAHPPEAQASFTAETPETWLHIPLPVPIHTNIYARVVCHCPQGQLVCEGMGSGPSFYFQQGSARTDTA